MYDEIIIDKDNLEIINKSLKYYNNEEKIIIEDFDNIYSDIKKIYRSTNNNYLEQLESEISLNFKTVSNNHDNNILLINKRIEKVIEIETKVKQIDENNTIGEIVK